VEFLRGRGGLDVAAPPRRREDVEGYLDRLNQELLDRIQRSGESFVSNAVATRTTRPRRAPI
jgi:hypothetical protein